MPRPYVPTTRSLSLIAMSRYDVFGRLSCSDCQWSPSSNETYIDALGAGEEQPRLLRVGANHAREAAARLIGRAGRSTILRPRSCRSRACDRSTACSRRVV